jgi:hypothetical protein
MNESAMHIVTGSARSGFATTVRGRVVPTGRLARAAALAAQVAVLDAESPLAPARRVVVSAAALTSTDVAVVALAASGEAPSVIVKLPMNDNAAVRLEHELATLRALHEEPRLGGWRQLLPRPLTTGIFRGQRYRVETALAGHSAAGPLTSLATRRGLLQAATDAIAVLHRATAVTVRGDPALVRGWVDAHLEELEPHLGRDRRLRLTSARLSEELHEALERVNHKVSRIHGDYWLGNVLLASPASRRGAIAGIVDWDASERDELPIHDLLHLEMYTRSLLARQELGGVVSEQLRNGKWPDDVRLLLDRSAIWSDDGALSARHALLLYWLRHVAIHTRQHSQPAGWRFKLWHRRNVLPVLESL